MLPGAGVIGTVDGHRILVGRLDGAVKDPDELNTQEKAQLLRAAHFMLQAAGPINVQGSGAVAQKV